MFSVMQWLLLSIFCLASAPVPAPAAPTPLPAAAATACVMPQEAPLAPVADECSALCRLLCKLLGRDCAPCQPGQCEPGQCGPGACGPGACPPGACKPSACEPGACKPNEGARETCTPGKSTERCDAGG